MYKLHTKGRVEYKREREGEVIVSLVCNRVPHIV